MRMAYLNGHVSTLRRALWRARLGDTDRLIAQRFCIGAYVIQRNIAQPLDAPHSPCLLKGIGYAPQFLVRLQDGRTARGEPSCRRACCCCRPGCAGGQPPNCGAGRRRPQRVPRGHADQRRYPGGVVARLGRTSRRGRAPLRHHGGDSRRRRNYAIGVLPVGPHVAIPSRQLQLRPLQ